MRRHLLLLPALLLAPFAARADCVGRDLIADLSPVARAAIESRADAEPFPEGNRWLAEKPGSRIVVVGTLHLSDARMEGPMERLKPEIEQADAVYLEATDAELKALKEAVSKAPDLLFVPTGPTLPERLSEQDWQIVAREASARGIPAFMASKMRPWYLVVMLGLPPCAMKALSGGRTGLDGMVMDAADAAGVPTRALEPWDTLLTVFGSMDDDQQLDMLRAATAMTEGAEDQFVTLQAAYFAEEHRLLWEVTRATALAEGGDDGKAAADFALLEEALLTRRNRVWLDALLPAAEGKRIVVAVGAAHLSGKEGLLKGLADAGYSVTRQEF